MAQTLVYDAKLSDLSEFNVYDNPTRNDAQGPRSKTLVQPFNMPGAKVPATVEVSTPQQDADGSYSWTSTFIPEKDGPANSGIAIGSGMVNGKWMSSGMSAAKCPHIVAGMALEFDFACTPYASPGGGKVAVGLWGVNSWPPEVDLFESWDETFQQFVITNHFDAPGKTPPRDQAQIPGIKGDFTKRTTFRYELNATGQFFYVNGKQVGSQTSHLPNEPLYFFAQTACQAFPKIPTGPYSFDLYGLRAYTL